MTNGRQPTTVRSWREAALAKSEIISDAWEVTKTYAGRIAEWVLFLCMVMNIIEILVTLPLTLSNIVLGTQVVMLDVGGFSLATMGEQAREQGEDRAARKASLTGYFLIGVTIVTLLLVTIGLLWSPAKYYTDQAEKGLILVRVVMTVIYAHVIHSLRRATTRAVSNQVQAVAATFTEQVQHLASELASVQENVQRQLATGLASMQERMHMQLATELAALHASLHQCQEALASLPAMQARLQQLENSPVKEPHQQGERPVLRALPAMPHTPHKATPQATTADKFDARAFVFACLQENPAFKLAEIEQLAQAQGQELSQSSISRYRKQFARQVASSHESSAAQGASSSLHMQGHDASRASAGRKVVGE